MRSLKRLIRPEKSLYWALLALVVWLPVPLGSNRAWAWALMEVAAFTMLAVWLVLWARDKVVVEVPLRKSWPVFALLGAWVLLLVLQITLRMGEGYPALTSCRPERKEWNMAVKNKRPQDRGGTGLS